MIKRIFDIVNNVAKHVGYVYLFEYVNEEAGEELYKIGVSDQPRRRFSAVKSALPGQLTYLGAFPVWSPTYTERYLHKKYADLNTRPIGAGPAAGADEFFALSYWQSWKVTLWLWAKGPLAISSAVILPFVNLILWWIGPVKIASFLTSLSTIVDNP